MRKMKRAKMLMAGLMALSLFDVSGLAQEKSNAELLELIKKLEARIAELEGKAEVSKEDAAAESQRTPTETKASEEAVAEKESDGSAPILDFFKQTKVSGYVDAYYGFSTNQPESGIVDFRGLDTRHNSLQFDLAKITFDRAPGDVNSLGYRIDLVYGPAADSYHSFEPVSGQTDIIKNIQQAYVSYVAPVGDGLTIDVGKFGTFVGAEVLDTIDNWQYQQSILFGFAQPYYHTGVRTSYPVSEQVDLGFYLVNGWNNSTDNNKGKSVGWSVAYSPNSNFSISQGYLGGPELGPAGVVAAQLGPFLPFLELVGFSPDDLVGPGLEGFDSPWRHLFDTVISATVHDQVELLINYDYGFDSPGSPIKTGSPLGELLRNNGDGFEAGALPTFERTTWQGIAGAVRFSTPDKKWAFSPRFEYFADRDAFATGVSQALKEITLTADYRVRPNFSTKFEYRYDWSDQPFFVKKGVDELVVNQSVFLIGLVYRFGFGEE